MKVFIHNIDAPVPRAIARLLAHTPIGIRKASEEDAEEEPEGGSVSAKPTYEIIGTLSAAGEKFKEASNQDESRPGTALSQPRQETPGRKYLANRKGQLPVADRYYPPGTVMPWISRVIPRDDVEAIKAAWLECDVVVYDILQSYQDASAAIEYLNEQTVNFGEKQKTFILVSTVMTWAKSKPESDEPDGSLTEEDFRKRKAHANFKEHLNVEKVVLKIPKESPLKTWVIASGVVYHPGNGLFHSYLKTAWQCQRDLPLFGDGENLIPTIHLSDLANIVTEVVEVAPEQKYILAIDEGKYTAYQLVKAISDNMGTGKVVKVAKDDAFLHNELSQAEVDMLQINVKLEIGCVKEFGFEWKYETGLLENIGAFLSEFREFRGLKPINIVVHGPPFVGKTTLAKKLAQHYEIHYLDPDQIVQDAIAGIEAKVNAKIDDAETDLSALKTQLQEFREYVKSNDGKYPPEQVLQFVGTRLHAMPCKNQGYILDGYPTRTNDATQLFQLAGEEDTGGDDKSSVEKSIFPQFVFSLEASDDVLRERILQLPESEINPVKTSEEAFLRRLEDFRRNDTDEKSVLNFFDLHDVYPITYAVETQSATQIFDATVKSVGRPRNYGPTDEQLLEIKRKKQEEKIRLKDVADEEKRKKDQAESERQAKAELEWKIRHEIIQKEESEALATQSAPLRDYLVRNVMPSLTAGLIELCKVRPEDPVDFLAEYLFRHSEHPAPSTA